MSSGQRETPSVFLAGDFYKIRVLETYKEERAVFPETSTLIPFLDFYPSEDLTGPPPLYYVSIPRNCLPPSSQHSLTASHPFRRGR